MSSSIVVKEQIAVPAERLWQLVRFSGAPVPSLRPPPVLGQHTREILAELGYRAEQTSALAARGVVAYDDVAERFRA